MKIISLAIMLSLTTLFLCHAVKAEDKKCILPAPDYRGLETSEPTVKGTIAKIQPGFIEIEPLSRQDNHNKSNLIRIRINKETEMYTQFGGGVNFIGGDYKGGLRLGETVNIWYVGCDVIKAGSPPLAAYIEVVR
jgi:hypothetical protein